MRLEVVSLAAGGADEITVTFEMSDGERASKVRLLLPTEAYMRLDITKGECSTELYEQAEREAETYSAYKRGLYILGYGQCSERMLISKLAAKGHQRAAAERAVEQLRSAGYIDENSSALREAERCAAKLWGESRIRAALAEKRYSGEAISNALYALEDGGLDFDENCRKLIAASYPEIPTDRAQMQKLVAAVCRKGYGVSQIKAACLAVQSERRDKRHRLYD